MDKKFCPPKNFAAAAETLYSTPIAHKSIQPHWRRRRSEIIAFKCHHTPANGRLQRLLSNFKLVYTRRNANVHKPKQDVEGVGGGRLKIFLATLNAVCLAPKSPCSKDKHR